MNRPTVSVILPTYNRAALLPRAIDSILNQTVTDWEIVFVDDGSTDHTRTLAARYGEQLGERFVYLSQPNQGGSAARNRGIERCGGRFVAFLDSDDEFAPAKLERQLVLFERCPELGLVYSDFSFVDLEGVHHASAFDAKFPLARQVRSREVGPGLCVCEGSLFDTLIQGYFIATIVGLVRREVLGSSIRFDEDQAYSEEWLFYLHVAKCCAAGFVDEPLSIHHFVSASLARSDKQRNSLRYRILLSKIRESFPGLTSEQGREIDRQLAQTCRQLGYNAEAAGRYNEARSFFGESWRYEPGIISLRDAARAWVHSVISPKRESPDETDGETTTTGAGIERP